MQINNSNRSSSAFMQLRLPAVRHCQNIFYAKWRIEVRWACVYDFDMHKHHNVYSVFSCIPSHAVSHSFSQPEMGEHWTEDRVSVPAIFEKKDGMCALSNDICALKKKKTIITLALPTRHTKSQPAKNYPAFFFVSTHTKRWPTENNDKKKKKWYKIN